MIKKYFLITILSICLISIFGFSQKVLAKSYEYENFEVDIKINKDSTFDVSEKQTFDFRGDFTYAYRSIELRKLDRITDLKVLDEKGNALPESSISRYREGNKEVIKWYYTAHDEKKTWIVKYKVHGGIGYFNTWDELYWNAVPNEREVYIEKVKVTVHLPQKCDVSKLKSEVYTENPNLTYPVHKILDGKTFQFTGHSLEPNTNFTIVAGWPSGIVYNPGILKIKSDPDKAKVFLDNVFQVDTKKDEFVVLKRDTLGLETGEHEIKIKKWGYAPFEQKVNIQEGKVETIEAKLKELYWHKVFTTTLIIIKKLYFISPFFLIILMYLKWRRKGKDPAGRKVIVPQYEPPDNIEPAVMGTLIDEGADIKDIIATIVDLAVRGYLKIIEGKKVAFGRRSYSFKKLKEFTDDLTLKEFERVILKSIFKNSNEVKLFDLKNKFYTNIPIIQELLYSEVTRLGYFEERPDKVRRRYLMYGGILIGISIVFAVAVSSISVSSMKFSIPLFCAAVILFIFAMFMPKKTLKGVLASEHAKGFKMYLSVAEKFRIGVQTPETFERFLPYAMIFGVEDKWANRFSDIYKKQPNWYQSSSLTSAFSMSSFSNGLSFMSSSFSSVAKSSPSSSSGFGGGGGGGAGGGGGGGGGGAG